MFRTGDFTEDFGGGLCPNVGLRAAVVVIEIVHDGLLQFVDALEDAAANAFSGDLGKEPLDHVEPRARSGRKVQVKARMPLEPALYRRGLVGGIIVDDEMQVEIGQSPFVDGLEKAEELAMPVAGHALADDCAVEHVESRKQVVVPLRL